MTDKQGLLAFQCPICGSEDMRKDAIQMCIDSHTLLKVGDIVKIEYLAYTWFNGDVKWLILPHQDIVRFNNGYSSPIPQQFYYVVTHIDKEKHRTRYHLFTNAMTGENSFNKAKRSGYIFNSWRRFVKVEDAPDYVVSDSKSLIGLKAKEVL